MLSPAYGLARSMLMYRARPLKRLKARRLYGRFVRPGDLCFDIGAHVGDRVSTFLALGGCVVAIEPQPLFHETLSRLYGNDSRVQLLRVAVGETPGTAEMLISSRTPTMSTLAPDWAARVGKLGKARGVRWDGSAEVRVVTLDTLIADHGMPAFCKIDVEGFELHALSGLSQPLPALSFEYLPGAIDEAILCLERLTTLGRYQFNVSIRETMRLRFASWVDRTVMETWLRDQKPTDWSGDVYARQVEAKGYKSPSIDGNRA